MNCVNCGAPLPPKTTRCAHCHTLNEVDLRGQVTVRGGTTSRDCPRCKERLHAVLLQVGASSVELDRCEACHGLFFDPGEVETILDGIEKQPASVDHRQLLTLIETETPTEDLKTVAYVPCPDCGQLMHRRSFGQKAGVVIDSCKDHGLWLDGGELRRLIRWTQAGGRRHDADETAARAQAAERAKPRPEPREPTLALPTSSSSGGGWGWGGALDALDLVELVVALGRIVLR